MKLAPEFRTFEIVRDSWLLLSSKQRRHLAFLTVGRLFVNAFDLLGIVFLAVVIAMLGDSIGALAVHRFIPSVFVDNPPILLGTTGLLFVTKALLGVVLARMTAFALARIESDAVEEACKHIYAGSLKSFSQISRPDLEWSIMRSSTVALSVLLMQTSTLIAEITLAIGILCLMFAADWATTLSVAVFLLTVSFVFQQVSGNRLKIAGDDMRSSTLDSSKSLADLTSTFREMVVAGKVTEFLEGLSRSRRKLAMSNARYSFLQSLPKTILETVTVVSLILFLLVLLLLFPGDSLSFSLGIILVASLRLLTTALPITRSLSELRFLSPQAVAAQELIAKARKSSMSRAVESHVAGLFSLDRGLDAPAAVELRDVRFSHPLRKSEIQASEVIDDVSFSLSPGESCAIVGSSGSGKSTLLELLVGLHAPSSGLISIDGIGPSKLILESPGSVGFVPQEVGIISGSLLENVILSRHQGPNSSEAALVALQMVGLGEFLSELPSGLETDLGAHVDEMSGGQKQRIGIARALASGPRLLVLDEATSALDAVTEAEVITSLLAQRDKFTLVAAAHRISPLRLFDRIIVMQCGKVVASGPYEMLINQSPTFARFVELMSTEQSESRNVDNF